MTTYPFSIQNFQSSSLNTRNGSPLLRSFSLVTLDLAVDGLPGISLWALAGVIVIVMAAMVSFSVFMFTIDYDSKVERL
jgi:hypothetical protein